MAASPQFVNAPNVGLTKFVNADGTTIKTIFTPGASGARVMGLFATSTDTAALQFVVYLNRGGTRYMLDTVTLPAATAITPTTNWNLLDTEWFKWLDANEPHIILPSDITLQAGPLLAVTAAKEVSFIVLGGDF